MRVIVSTALLLLAVIFLTVILRYRSEGLCGCPFCRGGCARQISGQCPFHVAYEAFGTSPGTMTQLATSHVPTDVDLWTLKKWLADRERGVYMMTQEDLDNGAPMVPLRIGAYN